MLVLPNQRLSPELSKSVLCVLSCKPVSYRPHTLTGIVLLLGWQINILSLKLFPNRVPKELSQIALPTIVLPRDDRTDFAQEEQLDLPYWTMILAICALVDVSKYLDTLTLEFFITLTHPPFWPEYKRILHLLLDLRISLEIMSITFAALIWDADDPCSLNTAYAPESSFTMSPRSTTLPCIFDIEVPTPNS